ncbi:DUF551 domain-containing protein [Escherichia coli]|uniref:DUF551 domain-containing protein n=1 Tax=Escherichia albertii TaxID=208962 RepID=UPI000F68D102|nr:DUF551 domain-containing protein [Escherichia albertii]EFJ8977100.1 DUF551 domain-containing protein [Escherichia coli]
MITITKEFTKEQLIEQAKKNIEVLRVAVERVPGAYDAAVIHLKLAEITLASLEAKPIGAFHIAEQQVDGTSDYLKDGEWPIDNGIIEVYAAPPVPVVPEEKPMPNPLSMYAVDAVAAIAEVRGWNACRAAMLHGSQPVSQTYKLNKLSGNSPVTPDGWISCSDRMPVIGELNWRTSFPLLITCEIGVIPAYYGFVSVNGDRHYGFMESIKYGDDSGNHPQTNEYGLISNVTHWMPLPEPPQEVNRG